MGRAKFFRNTIQKTLKCNECHETQNIRRMKGRDQAIGHQKHIWCIKCKKITQHTEMD